MTNSRTTIEDLRLELERLLIAAENIRQTIDNLQATNEVIGSPNRPSDAAGTTSIISSFEPSERPRPEDRDGTPIFIGVKVDFLTQGKYRSTQGVVTRYSRNNERVFTIDSDGHEIARAPHNRRVSMRHHFPK